MHSTTDVVKLLFHSIWKNKQNINVVSVLLTDEEYTLLCTGH